MPGDDGHDKPPGNGRHRVSLRELMDQFVSTNGASGKIDKVDTLPRIDPTQLYRLEVLLPLFYNNRDERGDRIPVELSVFEKTFGEVQQYFSGFRLYEGGAWTHSIRFRGDFDGHIVVMVESFFTGEDMTFLKRWKRELILRFKQDSIYMSLSGPVLWL
jgi:hypothetical protein